MAHKRSHTHFEQLQNKWTQRHQSVQETLWQKHKNSLQKAYDHSRRFALGSLGGLMLLTATATPSAIPTTSSQMQNDQPYQPIDKNMFLIGDLYKIVPHEVRPLTVDEEDRVTRVLTERFGFPVKAEIDGKRLNRNYGYIGKEQHLARYPGDTMATHFDTPEEEHEHGPEGMAPGLGAWGYFAPSYQAMTPKDKEKEKYYIAVQTFLSEGFNERFGEYRDFYKHRKMLLVNPNNGRAIVVVIGDAGPAEWTGKSLGGSPEVMHYLERVDGRQKGPVLYYFIDDPDDTIPLGPIEVK